MADESLGGQSAIAEARGLYRLLSTGSTVEQIRMLISVPPKIEAVLLAYAEADVRDAYWILAPLRFRREVLSEFERPVADGCSSPKSHPYHE